MLSEYNELIKTLDTAYNAESAKGYEPLTDDEKESMSDDEVEKWETKIKDSLLRRDGTLDSVISSMKNTMLAESQLMVKHIIYQHLVFLRAAISPVERMKRCLSH